jgi:hypothetical protein
LSSKPQQGASAALDEPFGLTATAAGEAAAKLKSRQGVRLPNASESRILRELALARGRPPEIMLDELCLTLLKSIAV